MKNSIKSGICLLIFLVANASAFSQETTHFINLDADYKRGLVLLQQNKYMEARRSFEKSLSEKEALIERKADLGKSKAEYYIGYCAARSGSRDAEKLLLDFIAKNPESENANEAYFELGEIFFAKKSFSNSIKYYNQVDANGLDDDQLLTYQFHKGYAHFVKKEFKEAKTLFSAIKEVQSAYYQDVNFYYGVLSVYDGKLEEAERSFDRAKSSSEYAKVIPFYEAQIYYQRKEYQKVIDLAPELLKTKAKKYKASMLQIVGQSYYNLENYQESANHLGEFMNTRSAINPGDRYALGYSHYQLGNYDEAANSFERISDAEDSTGQNAMYLLADCYLQQGKKDEARNAFQAASSSNFDASITEESRFNYAKLSYELNYHKAATSSIESFINDYPNSSNYSAAIALLTNILKESRNFNDAIQLIEESSISGSEIDLTYQELTYFSAIEKYNDKQWLDAKALLEKSLTKSEDRELTALAHFLFGELYLRGKKYPEARSQFLKYGEIRKKTKKDHENASLFRGYYNVAYSYFKEKQYTKALNFYQKALAEAKRTGAHPSKKKLVEDATLRRGDCFFMTKSYNKALQDYRRIIDGNGKDADYALMQAGISYGLLSNFDAQVSAYEEIVGKHSKSPYADDALFKLGTAHQDAGKTEKAKNYYRQLIESMERSKFRGRAYLQIGLIEANAGKTQNAIRACKKAVEEYPGSPEAAEALGVLRELYISIGQPDKFIAYVNRLPNSTITTSAQDTILFQSAEEIYATGNCTRAITMLTNYLNEFPKGAFHIEAHNYRAECRFDADQFAKAYEDYKVVIEAFNDRFQERALIRAAYLAYYKLKNYQWAKAHYTELKGSAESNANRQLARMGILRSAQQLKSHSETILAANEIIESTQSSDEEILEAKHALGMAHFGNRNYNTAKSVLTEVSSDNSSRGAEAMYHIALINNLNGAYEQSLQDCFTTKDRFAGYERWVVKSFILIADNYFKLDNIFQAKATLESLLNNYDGDQVLVDEARAKLAEIERAETRQNRMETDEDTLSRP